MSRCIYREGKTHVGKPSDPFDNRTGPEVSPVCVDRLKGEAFERLIDLRVLKVVHFKLFDCHEFNPKQMSQFFEQ